MTSETEVFRLDELEPMQQDTGRFKGKKYGVWALLLIGIALWVGIWFGISMIVQSVL